MFVSAGTTADATVGKQMKQVHNLTNCGVIRSDILDAPQPQKIILQAFKPVVDVQHTRVNRWREGGTDWWRCEAAGTGNTEILPHKYSTAAPRWRKPENPKKFYDPIGNPR